MGLENKLARALLVGGGFCAVCSSTSAQAETALSVCYINHPVQVANVAILEKWAVKQGVKLNKTVTSYTVYLPKITQMLTSGANDQCDIIWNNDDWGQDLAQYLEPLEDVPNVRKVEVGQLEPFHAADGKTTAVSMTTTAGILFYRTDLISEAELPKTWDDLVKISQPLQSEKKVKWGYVGGMSYTNTFFSFWWTLWNNSCDVYAPAYERDNKKLAANGWKPMIYSPCQVQTAEFWWDALNSKKISPPGMTTYSRDEANAIFQAGDAAFTVADTTFLDTFNNSERSSVAGKVGIAPFPVGPMSNGVRTWIDVWGWSIPKTLPNDRKTAAKKLLGAMLGDPDAQIEQWNQTGGPPPNTDVWRTLEKNDATWRRLHTILFKPDHVHAAYYFRNWATVHKVYSDTLIRAMKGKREDIAATLKAGSDAIHAGATAND
ncbi:extracellular solute-binding protein [Bradyrhizobium australiense]|uniref:Extracellular solute-binding protein n=1 Tax=Bradyrhizobium australiense TaxID=2721161 RepID=A0A7Y4GSC5_9BRAD|nr:extracellular solute-binding protein [Bradyrhizobium australiense]NOJ41110.1 extracellular solute-binding protein [Bradyrhizobium australiense]